MFELFPDEDVVFAIVFDVHVRAVAEEEEGWVPPMNPILFAVVEADDIDW